MSPIRVAPCRPATSSTVSATGPTLRIRRGLLASVLALAVVTAAGNGHAETVPASCLYASRSYSDGALLCVQKSIALICRSEAGRFSWSTVADRELADRCTAASEPIVRPRLRHVRTAYRARQHEPATGAAKCFDFNGKRYCE
jgi:hypothetical protein